MLSLGLFMSRRARTACRILALGASALFAPIASSADAISHGRFNGVSVYRPAGEVRQFVLLLSDAEGWRAHLDEAARRLADDGAMVAAIDSKQLIDTFVKDRSDCFFPDGDLENLSHYIQAYYKLPAYLTPVLIGYSTGASIAYAMVTRAPPDIFTGAVLISHRRGLPLKLPLCDPDDESDAREPPRVSVTDRLARLQFVPAIERAGSIPTLEAAYARVAALRPAAIVPPASLPDLPIVEVPAEGGGDIFAVFLSGDGGWAGIDKKVAAALASRGIPVAGIDSLRYFWSERTPEGLAMDIARVLHYYAARWNKQRALLIGYSQGADVLPFAINRLPSSAKRMTVLAVLLSLSRTADFEFHLSNWISSSATGRAVFPEIEKLRQPPALCIYGSDDDETICPQLHDEAVTPMQLDGGHHFDGEYDKVARAILTAVAAGR